MATGRRMAELSGRDEYVDFQIADLTVEDVVDQTLLDNAFEVLILDPPREGASVVVERLVRQDRGGQLVYVSCDPACLARDAETLADGGWEMEKLTAFDMFPRTSHLEMIAVFERDESV